MAIDYRKEVDSGYDRKRIVESTLINLLKEGIPTDIILTSPCYNYRHNEMIKNLSYGYNSKLDEYLENFELYAEEIEEAQLPDRYSEVAHPVGAELYPMTPTEEKEKFKLRDQLRRDIENIKNRDIKAVEKEVNKAAVELTKFKAKHPIIDNIIAFTEELDTIELLNNNLLTKLFKKHGLDVKKKDKYNELYSTYIQLLNTFKDKTVLLDGLNNGKTNNAEVYALTSKLKSLETEIIQRNIKLVNGFIRQRYNNLLVESEELFQVCYIAMWEAANVFDVSQKNKFSSLAYTYMDQAVKHNFKDLTGYSWDDYWTKRKIDTLIKSVSAMLNQKVTVEDLVSYGFLDLTYTRAKRVDSLINVFDMSDFYDMSEDAYNEYEIDANYQRDFGDDEVLDFQFGIEETYDAEEDFREIVNNITREELDIVLNTLTEIERDIIIMRYGLNDGKPMTLEEVGRVYHVTRERIRQVEVKALRKMRHPARSHLRHYL